MKKMKIELLSPAKDAEVGIAAINHGADAVYIGGPDFGAREKASNSIQDIERLCRHASLFAAKVYVTLNTLLYERELERASKIAYDVSMPSLYRICNCSSSTCRPFRSMPAHSATT